MAPIMERSKLIKCIKSDEYSFEEKAILLYNFQYTYNDIYKQFVDLLRGRSFTPSSIPDIPFLPIALFKHRDIKTGQWNSDQVFLSSGTTIGRRSEHWVRDLNFYQENTVDLWEEQFAPLNELEVISLLPNYHENPNSSLITMVHHFMEYSKMKRTAFFKDDYQSLYNKIECLKKDGQKSLFFGVSFALLDYGERYEHANLENLTIVETGGMKKFAKELTRTQLHDRLKKIFDGATILSEYGMTECLSQMYCSNSRTFADNSMMRIVITDPSDYKIIYSTGKRGRVNIVDLANVDTIGFIATDDLGLQVNTHETEILGRLDHSDLRGCNYLI